jgi:excisionase family DNA binding protein
MNATETPNPTPWRDRGTLTVEETAAVLGISRWSAYALARSGDIPTIKLGRRVLVPTAKLRTMLGESAADEGGQHATLD